MLLVACSRCPWDGAADTHGMSMSERAAVHPHRRGRPGSSSGWEMRPSEAPLAKPRTELNQVSAGKGALRARAEKCHKADPGMTTGSSSGIDEKESDERCVPLRSTRRSSITSSSRRWMDVSPTPRPARCQNSRGQHGEDVVTNNDALARQLHLGPPRGVGNRTGVLCSGFMPTGSKHRVRFTNKHLLLSRPLRGLCR